MSSTPQSALALGWPVVTSDGSRIGDVKEISGSGNFFRVDAPMQRDYWLSAGLVSGASADGVCLSVASTALEAHQLQHPGAEHGLSPGAAVIASGGEDLGTLSDVSRRGTYFKVDAPQQFDYWLSRHHIATSSAECVTLSLAESDLGSHKLPAPGSEDAGDTFFKADETQAQRDRLEREMADQRARRQSPGA
jgi:hypothetical protein